MDTVKYGSVLDASLENTGNTSSTFLLLDKTSGSEDRFLDPAHFFAAFEAGITVPETDSIAWTIQAVQVASTFFKSNRFANHKFVYEVGGDSIFAPKTSLNAENPYIWSVKYADIAEATAQYNQQCFDYVIHVMRILHTLGISSDSLRIVNHHGQLAHASGEVFIAGSWMAFDPDPSQPSLMQKNRRSLNGYSAAYDIQMNRNLLVDRYLWVDEEGDSINIAAMRLDEYGAYYDSITYQPVEALVNIPVNGVGGEITLPPSAKLNFHYEYTALVADTTQPNIKSAYDAASSLITQYWMTGDSMYIDSATRFIADRFSMTLKDAASVLTGNCVFHSGDFKKNRIPYLEKIPTLALALPPSADTLVIGEDLKLPFLVTGINGGNGVDLGWGPIRGAVNYLDHLWSSSYLGIIEPAPVPSTDEVNYLVQGKVFPHTDTLTITLAYNPILMDWANGFSLSYRSGADSLVYVGRTGPQVLSVPEMQQDMAVYPNPGAAGQDIRIAGLGLQDDIRVYDLLGAEVPFERSEGSIRIMSKGIFFVRYNSQTAKICIF